MLKLRTILLSKVPYYSIFIIVLLITFIRLQIPYKSIYQGNETKLTGTLVKQQIEGDTLQFTLKAKENVICYYYFETKQEKEEWVKNYELGDKIELKGSLTKISNQTIPNLYSYKKNQNRKHIFYQVQVEGYQKLKENRNMIFFIKNKIEKRLEKITLSSCYIRAFLLGDKSGISSEVVDSYQENGISHLLAISGMHVSFLSGVILYLLKKIRVCETKRYIITMIFLFFYCLLTGCTPSVLRATLFFFLFSINKIYYFYIEPFHLFLLTLSICLFYQPYFIYEVGFQFSFLISFFLLQFSSFINQDKNRFLCLLRVSILSFFSSIPITIYHFYQINLCSILYNLFFVPFVTFIVYPMSILVFCFPFLDSFYHVVIIILERSSLLLGQISFGKLIFPKPSLFFVLLLIVLTIILFSFITKKNYKVIPLYLFVLSFYYCYPNMIQKEFMVMLDVGQGDSILLRMKNKTILIDTGGKMPYQTESWKRKELTSVVKRKTIPYLKSLGIRKIDYFILTHGDYDHMGEAINLVESFKIEKVIFNCGPYNDLEKELIKVTEKKKIKHYSYIKELDIGNNKLYFLNTKEYDDENDNSNVIYTELNGYKFMFMGDASKVTEKEILDEYNLSNIDVLKVGHHGSKTSSSKEFISTINPKYSIISVGKNNRYGHPDKEVLENLENSIVYRTDLEGSIKFKINNKKLIIETCPP